MKTKAFMIMAAAALVMAGCSNAENEVADNRNSEIRLSSGVAVQQTRANSSDVPDKQIAENQLIGIYVAKADDETTAYNGYANVSAKADGSGNFSEYSTTMYYPQSGKGVKIAAYHPYNGEATTDEYEFLVEEDQSDVAKYYKSDLLYSAATSFNRSKTAHSLTFEHKLCKITCALTAGEGISSVDGATVEVVYVERAVTFNRETGAVYSGRTSAPMNNVKLGIYGAIIAPQISDLGRKLLKVTLSAAAGGGEFYYTPTEQTSFTGGNLYAYNITVKATGLTVTSTIKDWTSIHYRNGDAVMD